MTSTTGHGFWQRNGLSVTLIALLLAALTGQVLTGESVYNAELRALGAQPVGLATYLHSGHFVSATFENWESEFLQMAMYVLLTVSLRQRGSAESRPYDPAQESERIDPGTTPWPVRVGGIWKRLYGHSLAIAFALLFALSFVLHMLGSWRREMAERVLKGEALESLATYATDPGFWFESFQNWQSEFMAVTALVVFTIWLRQKDSPQSKPLAAPHAQTGT